MKRSKPTIKQMHDATDTLQRVLETEMFSLTAVERLAILDTKKVLKSIIELRKKEG
jgi:hypothetical protein